MKKKDTNIKRVAIIGSQGVPAKYGGFETLVENIIGKNCSENVQYTVFCSGPDMNTSLTTHKNASLRYIQMRAHGVMSVPYDISSMIKSMRKYDTILVLGVSGGIFLPVLKILTRKKVIVNIDGLEHKREKWDSTARKFLKFSLGMCMHWADEIVSDNVGIQDFVKKEYGRDARLIAYGGDHVLRNMTEDRQNAILNFYDLKPGEYDIALCRIEPENNCHITLEAFRRTNRKIVFIGNWNHSDYSRNLYDTYHDSPNLKLLGAIYDLDILYALRINAKRYIHGHRAGGTNPSLVEAMFFGKPILAYDVIYNRETTRNLAYYFTSADELIELLNRKDLSGEKCSDYARQEYVWHKIAAQYEKLY